MGMRRAKELEMKQSFQSNVHRIARRAADDGMGCGRGYAAAAGIAGLGALDRPHAAYGVFHRRIAGATANVALQRPGQILFL
jgi:transcription initiation factor TFIIIB Brf1 subunit/transcription initiation factor TFIIB